MDALSELTAAAVGGLALAYFYRRCATKERINARGFVAMTGAAFGGSFVVICGLRLVIWPGPEFFGWIDLANALPLVLYWGMLLTLMGLIVARVPGKSRCCLARWLAQLLAPREKE